MHIAALPWIKLSVGNDTYPPFFSLQKLVAIFIEHSPSFLPFCTSPVAAWHGIGVVLEVFHVLEVLELKPKKPHGSSAFTHILPAAFSCFKSPF